MIVCRMLALVPVPTGGRELLAAFRGQAAESRAGPGAPERHGDGWGIVAARPGRVVHAGRRPRDASADPEFEETVKGIVPDATTILLAHLRQASQGKPSVGNTHPFIADGWAFCHNGTIQDLADEPGATYEGSTDSERYFRRLLRNLHSEASVEAALRRTVTQIEREFRFSSLTCLFTDGRVLYGYRGIGTDLENCGTRECALGCYGLAAAPVDGGVIVAQEPTHLGLVRGWREVPDGCFLEVRPGGVVRVGPLRTPSPRIPA